MFDLRDLTEEKLRAELKPWLKKALAYLVDHGETSLGGWYDSDDGKLYFDVSERYEDLEHAKRLGSERNQRGVYRIKDGKVYSTGGSGK
jgi:CRISPR/Cas system-associated protein Cas10 (large subunit of type III CRISPR-Cas system)